MSDNILIKYLENCNSCGVPIPPYDEREGWDYGQKNMSLCYNCWRDKTNEYQQKYREREKKKGTLLSRSEISRGAADNLRKLQDRTTGVTQINDAYEYAKKVGGIEEDEIASDDDLQNRINQAVNLLPEFPQLKNFLELWKKRTSD